MLAVRQFTCPLGYRSANLPVRYGCRQATCLLGYLSLSLPLRQVNCRVAYLSAKLPVHQVTLFPPSYLPLCYASAGLPVLATGEGLAAAQLVTPGAA